MQWCHFKYHWHHVMTATVPMWNLILIILTKQMQWYHWWCHNLQHHVMPMAPHDQKSYITCPFDHFDLSSGMLPLIMLLESCDTDTSINAITWPKKLSCISFWLFWLNKCSGAIDDASGITWCWLQWHHMTKSVMLYLLFIILTWQIEWNHWLHFSHDVTLTPASMALHDQKKPCCTLFQSSWPNKQNGVIDSTIIVVQCSHWY